MGKLYTTALFRTNLTASRPTGGGWTHRVSPAANPNQTELSGRVLTTLAGHQPLIPRACCLACPAIPAVGTSKGTFPRVTRPMKGIGS